MEEDYLRFIGTITIINPITGKEEEEEGFVIPTSDDEELFSESDLDFDPSPYDYYEAYKRKTLS